MRTVFFFSSADLFGPLNATFIIPVQRWKENKNRTGTSFPPPHPPPPLFSTTGCLKVERLKFFTVYDRAIYPRKTFTSVPIDTNVHGFHELLYLSCGFYRSQNSRNYYTSSNVYQLIRGSCLFVCSYGQCRLFTEYLSGINNDRLTIKIVIDR